MLQGWLKGAMALLAMALTTVAPAKAQDTVKIGAVFPMSGPNAEIGDIFARAAQIAVDHVNADKMMSKKLQLLIEDSQATPQGGVVAVNKLINVEKVPYVLGAYTAVSKAIAPIGDKAKVVTINGGAVGPDLARDPRYATNVARVANRTAMDAIIAAAFARHATDALCARLFAAGVAFGRVNDVAAFSAHPQLRRVRVDTPNGPIEIPAPPPIRDGERAPRLGAVPAIDQHGPDIRREFA